MHGRGATIAFNLREPDGRIIDERIVEQLAAAASISLRTGCFCNPGAGEVAFGLTPDRLSAVFDGGGRRNYDEYLRALGLQTAGAVRVSLGVVSDDRDIDRLLAFLDEFRDRHHDTSRLAPRLHC